MPTVLAKPDFLCIGAQKAGTSWLHAMLVQSPGFFMPAVKEIHYFNSLARGADAESFYRNRLAAMIEIDRQRNLKAGRPLPSPRENLLAEMAAGEVLTPDWYGAIFAPAGHRITGEFTPAYLALDAAAIRSVRSLLPALRIIVMIRDPLARNLSQVRMLVERSGKRKPDRRDWTGHVDKVLQTRRSHYAAHLPAWLDVFGRERILFIPFGDIRTRPAALLAEVEAFLGAGTPHDYANLTEAVHASSRVEIPDWVTLRLQEGCERQRDFIENLLGRDFLARID